MNNIVPVIRTIKLFKESIVEIVYNDNVKIKLAEMEEAYSLLYQTIGERRVARLLIIGNGTEITNSARFYSIEENAKRKDKIIAEAIVVNSMSQRLSTTLYMDFTKKHYPTRCFKNEEKAREWLTKQMQKNDSD